MISGVDGSPKKTGMIRNVDQFDAAFFGCHPRLSSSMDPRHRIFLETAYECIVDAGYNPKELRGTNTGEYSIIVYGMFTYRYFP